MLARLHPEKNPRLARNVSITTSMIPKDDEFKEDVDIEFKLTKLQKYRSSSSD